jgi:hypothetical protein
MTGDPLSYSIGNPPVSTGASAVVAQQVTGSADPAMPIAHKISIQIHSLQRGGAGMFIENITLVIKQASPVPDPLNVWLKGAPLDYHGNPYLAIYRGEPAGSSLGANYVGPIRGAHVQLAPGESDELDISLASHIPEQLQFQVQIEYRIGTDLTPQVLTLPYLFSMVFSDPLHWRQYILQGSQMVPA